MEELKLPTAHVTVGWLNSAGPVPVMATNECDDPNCGCHEAIREMKKRLQENECLGRNGPAKDTKPGQLCPGCGRVIGE